ncbi:entry exclusion lipoprotein TrbK [Pseudomonas sp. F1_0610]|uniref:entry exclusion lipoprotein TrbK n=1 Tax=Pseudomonas sp. F1_0610 TaxID=3114284 RepID=UPI0039C3A37D
MQKIILLSLGALFFVGCAEPVPPEVNDENCETAKIEKMDKRIRTEFADKCVTRSRFKPSEPVRW